VVGQIRGTPGALILEKPLHDGAPCEVWVS